MKKLLKRLKQRFCLHKNLASDGMITLVFCRDCEWHQMYSKGGNWEGFLRNRKYNTPLWSDGDGVRYH